MTNNNSKKNIQHNFNNQKLFTVALLHDLLIKRFGQEMNSLHICAHYDEGKLLSVPWLPMGQSMMSTFTCIFWLAAAVFCQLDALCMCMCMCVRALTLVSKQIHPSSPYPTGTCSISLGSPPDSVHTQTHTILTLTLDPPISRCPCPH